MHHETLQSPQISRWIGRVHRKPYLYGYNLPMFCKSITFQRSITCPSFSSVEIQRYFSRRKLRILQICEPKGPRTTQRGQCMLSYKDYGNLAPLGHQVVPTESTPHYATIDAAFRCSFDFESFEEQIVGADSPAKNISDKAGRERKEGD